MILWRYRELTLAVVAWAAYTAVVVLVVLALRRVKREAEKGLDPGSLPVEWHQLSYSQPVPPEDAAWIKATRPFRERTALPTKGAA